MEKYNEEEKASLRMKLEYPDKEIRCPRCDKLLSYRAVGNSSEVKCASVNCLYASVRGI